MTARSLLARTIAATLGGQMLVVFASLAVPVTAATIATALGLNVHLVGAYSALLFFASAFAALATPTALLRSGSVRIHQAMLVAAGAGLLAVAIASGPFWLIVSAVLIGFAYGPANPASSTLLREHAPPHLRARVFALKQTSVPIGGAFAGLVLPALAQTLGWRWAALAAALLCFAAALALTAWRRELDAGQRGPSRGPLLRALREPLQLVARIAPLRRIGGVALAFGATQFCFSSVFASLLVERVGWSPVAAGSALSLALFCSIGSRLFWGWLADRMQGERVLCLIGVLIAATDIAAACIAPAWPVAAILAVAVAFGFTAFAWNGVMLHLVAEYAPRDRVATATAGVMCCLFLGSAFGPAVFSALVSTGGRTDVAFLILGATSLIAAFSIVRPVAHQPTMTPSTTDVRP
ncbi:MAG: transporter [Rhodospirillales bacterium]|nr:transporter [Rhodospirillales bacterium]